MKMKVKYRVKSHQDFQKVIRGNKKKYGHSYIVYSSPNAYGYPRFGISTPNRLGNAVVRNRIRRQVRAMLREMTEGRKGTDYVIVVKNAYSENEYKKNYEDLKSVLDQIKED